MIKDQEMYSSYNIEKDAQYLRSEDGTLFTP